MSVGHGRIPDLFSTRGPDLETRVPISLGSQSLSCPAPLAASASGDESIRALSVWLGAVARARHESAEASARRDLSTVWARYGDLGTSRLPLRNSSEFCIRQRLPDFQRIAAQAIEDYLRVVEQSFPGELHDAFLDLEGVSEESRELDVAIPSASAHRNVRRLLPAMYRVSPCRFFVYPLHDGEIAIDATSRNRDSVIVVCDSGEGAVCLVSIGRDNRRARYADADRLPDAFLREALAELAATAGQQVRGAGLRADIRGSADCANRSGCVR